MPERDNAVLGKRFRASPIEEEDVSAAKHGARKKLACQTCRARKVKCDQVRPQCGFCKSIEAVCVFAEKPEDKLSLDPATRFMVGRLEQILSGVEKINDRMDQDKKNQPTTATTSILSRNTRLAQTSEQVIELFEEYLQIPSCVASPDIVLTWPIFRSKYPPSCFINYLDEVEGDTPSDRDILQPSEGSSELRAQIPTLIDRFLSYVHTKNPILDVYALVRMGRKASEQGLAWDAQSCLVLIACALGAVSHPFVRAFERQPGPDGAEVASKKKPDTSIFVCENDLRSGETLFHLANRRLGLLKHTMLGAQCYFFAGVYLMYTLRPLEAWTRFYQASVYYQFFLKAVGGPSSEAPLLYDAERLQRIDRLQRRQEQSAYWSCFKSEVEFRTELPLPQSSISGFEYPALFPSPPEEALPQDVTSESAVDSPWHEVIEATYGSGIREFRRTESLTSQPDEAQELRRHSNDLYNEQESWYYYLTEVALRRIGNRIINTFHRVPRETWMNIKPWIPLAQEFDAQISTWSATLPSAMQTFSDTFPSPSYKVAGPAKSKTTPLLDRDANRISASKELSWCTENRLLEMRCRLYQPFLYCAIHHGLNGSRNLGEELNLSSDEYTLFQKFVQAGIACHLRTLRWRTLRHRHHGIWFDLRAVMGAVVILCAAARSGTIHIPKCIFTEGRDPEDGRKNRCGEHEEYCISFENVFDSLRYWEDETRDIQKSRVLLEELVQATKSQLLR